jgi:hypothetical protein
MPDEQDCRKIHKTDKSRRAISKKMFFGESQEIKKTMSGMP